MTDAELRSVILGALAGVAPEIDPASLRSDVPLRDQVDIDSMDFLNFIVALDHALGLEVPEADYASLATLDAAVAYLQAHSKRP